MGCDCSKEQDKDKDLVTLYSKFAVEQNVESRPGIEKKKKNIFDSLKTIGC